MEEWGVHKNRSQAITSSEKGLQFTAARLHRESGINFLPALPVSLNFWSQAWIHFGLFTVSVAIFFTRMGHQRVNASYNPWTMAVCCHSLTFSMFCNFIIWPFLLPPCSVVLLTWWLPYLMPFSATAAKACYLRLPVFFQKEINSACWIYFQHPIHLVEEVINHWSKAEWLQQN